jgi:imidazolonepropionase
VTNPEGLRTARGAGTLVVRRIGRLLTMAPGADPAGIPDAAVVVRDGTVVFAGPEADLPGDDVRGVPVLDAGEGLATPGLVECHTHLVFAGARSDEFELRAAGTSYEEIARRGGGIWRTVTATRAASRDELLALAVPRAWDFLSRGVTTIEVKSGYGLDLPTEMRILEAVRGLSAVVPADFVPTFLGAHALPPEGRGDRGRWVDAICREWIPAVAAAGLARFCDVFCESVAFTRAESEAVLRAGLDHGLRPKVHADQLSASGGTSLAAEVGAVSADHLDRAPAADLAALAAAGTVGVLLPGCMVSLGRTAFPDARPLRAAGVRVALSTDYNPGSSVTRDLCLMGTLGMAYGHLSLAETWAAVTSNAAAAVGLEDRLGRLAPGFQGDLAVFPGDDPRGPFCEYGGTRAAAVVKRGRVVLRRSPRGEVTLAD